MTIKDMRNEVNYHKIQYIIIEGIVKLPKFSGSITFGWLTDGLLMGLI